MRRRGRTRHRANGAHDAPIERRRPAAPSGAARDTTASSRSLSMSGTAHLLQQHAQAVARAHHSHLQRRNADAGQLRHLVVPHPFHVLEEERFALLGPQFGQRPIDLLPPRPLLGRMLLRRRQQRALVGQERARAPRPPRPGRPAAIDENAEQPGAEPFRILAPPPASDTPARTRPAAPRPRPRGCRACAWRIVRTNRGSAPPAWRTRPRRPPAPVRQSTHHCVHPYRSDLTRRSGVTAPRPNPRPSRRHTGRPSAG